MKQPDDLLLHIINKFLINFTDIFYYIIEKSYFNYNFIIKWMTYYYISVKFIPHVTLIFFPHSCLSYQRKNDMLAMLTTK